MLEMLTYMYTGDAPNLDKMADQLLSAADKVTMTTYKFNPSNPWSFVFKYVHHITHLCNLLLIL